MEGGQESAEGGGVTPNTLSARHSSEASSGLFSQPIGGAEAATHSLEQWSGQATSSGPEGPRASPETGWRTGMFVGAEVSPPARCQKTNIISEAVRSRRASSRVRCCGSSASVCQMSLWRSRERRGEERGLVKVLSESPREPSS